MQDSCLTPSLIISNPLQNELPLLREILKSWFLENQRALPWRETRDPYSTWIAEVMLQQTQAAVVIPYFKKWLQLFPTLQALAMSPLEPVLKTWEGLGYYSRAKNLHAGAKEIVEKHGGIFPSAEKSLLGIKGIGPYTSKAILSFAFKQKTAPIDGNVMRVIARIFGIEISIEKTGAKQAVSYHAESLLPEKDPSILAEALIEFGATICQKKAKCHACPISHLCKAYQSGKQHELPIVKKRAATTVLNRLVAVIRCQNLILVKLGEEGKIMEHLFEFPFIEGENFKELQNLFGLKLELKKTLEERSHSFTRYQAHLTPYLFEAEAFFPINGHAWMTINELKSYPFSSGHRKIFEEILITCE